MRIKPLDKHERWFDIPNDHDGGRMLIRELAKNEIIESVNAAALRSANSQISAESEYLREFLGRHIVAWENILNENGEPIPCTYDNKIRVLGEPDIFAFIGDAIKEINAEGAKQRGVCSQHFWTHSKQIAASFALTEQDGTVTAMFSFFPTQSLKNLLDVLEMLDKPTGTREKIRPAMKIICWTCWTTKKLSYKLHRRITLS